MIDAYAGTGHEVLEIPHGRMKRGAIALERRSVKL